MLLLHVDALAPATADLPPCRNLRLRQPLVHSGRNGCQASHHETHRLLPRSLCFEVGDVGFQGLPPGAPPGHARCIGRLVAQTCGLTSAQPRSPSAPLVYLSFQARGRRRLLVGGRRGRDACSKRSGGASSRQPSCQTAASVWAIRKAVG